MFKVEVIRDVRILGKNGGHIVEKGTILDCFAVNWLVDYLRQRPIRLDGGKEDYFDKTFLFVWIENIGWAHIEMCYLKPVGVATPPEGMC